MGYHTGTRHPELLDATRTTSCSKITCSNRTRRGACPRTCSWSRNGPRSARRTTTPSLRERRRPSHPKDHRPDVHPLRPAKHGPDLRVDRPHLPVARAARVVGLLRRRRHAARLRQTAPSRARPCRKSPAPRASGTRCRTSTRCATTINSATSNRPKLSHLARHGTLPDGLVGRAIGSRQRAPTSPDQRRRQPTSRSLDQRRHARPRLELDRDLPRLGRLGRLLRPRRSHRSSIRTATGSASPASSSARTPGAATSTTRRSASTPTTSSSKTTSSTANASTRKTDGRPDPRPTVRENVPILGNLAKDFDFSQAPRQPVLLPTDPKSTLVR